VCVATHTESAQNVTDICARMIAYEPVVVNSIKNWTAVQAHQEDQFNCPHIFVFPLPRSPQHPPSQLQLSTLCHHLKFLRLPSPSFPGLERSTRGQSSPMCKQRNSSSSHGRGRKIKNASSSLTGHRTRSLFFVG
jgi:hypothetical protein